VRECIDAVRSNTDAEHEIVLVENRSPPQGYTAPVNAGIRAAQGQYVVVLNDDVQMMEGWWPPMRKALDEGALVSFADFGGFPKSDLFAAPCFALGREALAECSHSPDAFLDPRFKVWFQDLDLLLRLCEMKRPPIPVASPFQGKWATTVKSLDDPEMAAWVREQIAADMRAFSDKWSGGRRAPRARAILAPFLEEDQPAAMSTPGEAEPDG
jgi:hypothetical protein